MSGLRTSLPVLTQPWEVARARFLEGLSEEESKRFKDATLENVFYDASAAQKMHAQKSRSWLMQQRLSSLIDSAADYGKALDVYSNTYGLIVCPIWGSLRVVLHIAREAGKFQEKLVEMLAQIGDVLPRFRIYQALFRDHERLLVALSAAYLDVLRFCVRTKDFFKRAKQSMIPLSIVLKGAWKSFRTSFEESMLDFRKHSNNIEKEANLAHMIESARRHEIELANRALQIRNQKLAQRHRVLSGIPSVDYQSKLARLSDQRHPGTTKWIQQNSQFTSWSTSTRSDCLWVYGIPGCGKSVLSASVIDCLQKDTSDDPKSLVCYYIIDYADIASLDPLRVIGSLIQQVLLLLPLDRFDESLLCPFVEHRPWPEQLTCIRFLVDLLSGFKNVWLIVDAIDELASEAQTVVLNLIDQFLGSSSTTIKILVTSRVDDQLARTRLNAHYILNITFDQIDGDIALFVEEKIKTIAATGNSVFENDLIRKEVIDGLTENAKGMFLWVRFQLYNLAEVLTVDGLRKVMKDLPKDLHETYSRIIEKAMNGPSGETKIAIMQKLFRWVAVARRPLKIEELQEAAGLEKTDTCLHTDRTATHLRQRLMSYCGNLLVFNEGDGTVSFTHHTIRQFLYSAPQDFPNQASSSSIKCAIKFLSELELQSANIEIGNICLAYLDFTDFETQIVRSPKALNLKKGEAERLVWMGVPLAAPIKGLLSWTQTRSSVSKARDDCEITYTIPASAKPFESLVRKYTMLDYISTFWVFHTAHLTPESLIWDKFKRITLYRTLSFEHRPWHDQDHRKRVELTIAGLQSDISQKRSIDRIWGPTSKQDWVGNDMLMYSWSLEHGVVPPLRLLDQEGLFSYLELIETSQEESRVWTFGRRLSLKNELESFLEAVITDDHTYEGPNGFWNGDLIFRSAICMRLSECKLLEFIELEHSRWVEKSKAAMELMTLQAILVAIRGNMTETLNCLLFYRIHTWDDLISTLVEIVRNGCSNPWALNSLLRCKVVGDSTPQIEWQLVFALQECFPVLESLIHQSKRYEEAEAINMAILRILLAVVYRPSLVHKFLDSGVVDYYRMSLHVDLPEIDWTVFPFGSEQVYTKVRAFDNTRLINDAQSVSRLVTICATLKNAHPAGDPGKPQLNGQSRSDLLRVFDAKSFEADGIHMLALILPKYSHSHTGSKFIEELVPFYVEFVRDQWCRKEVLNILNNIQLFDVDNMRHVVPLLPPTLLYETLLRLKGTTPRLDGQEKFAINWLLANTEHPSLLTENFMNYWKIFTQNRRYTEGWELILKRAFIRWRRTVEKEWQTSKINTAPSVQ